MLVSIDNYELDDDHWIYNFVYEVMQRLKVPEDAFIFFDIETGYEAETGNHGWITDVDRKDCTYYVRMDGGLDFVNTLRTIAHELRHMEQIHNRVWRYMSDDKPIFWRGMKITEFKDDPADEPWEVDAEEFAVVQCADLIQKYYKILQKINPHYVEWIPE